MRWHTRCGNGDKSCRRSTSQFLVLPMIRGMRPLGAPLGAYALRVHRLLCNGKALPLARETLAIIDTGTVLRLRLKKRRPLPLPRISAFACDGCSTVGAKRIYADRPGHFRLAVRIR